MKKIGSGALPFSSFLTGICGGMELGGREADVGIRVSMIQPVVTTERRIQNLGRRQGKPSVLGRNRTLIHLLCLPLAYTMSRGKRPLQVSV